MLEEGSGSLLSGAMPVVCLWLPALGAVLAISFQHLLVHPSSSAQTMRAEQPQQGDGWGGCVAPLPVLWAC